GRGGGGGGGEGGGARGEGGRRTAPRRKLAVEPRGPERPLTVRSRRDAESGHPGEKQPHTRDDGGHDTDAPLLGAVDDAGSEEQESEVGKSPVTRAERYQGRHRGTGHPALEEERDQGPSDQDQVERGDEEADRQADRDAPP